MKRRETKPVKIGKVKIGGTSPIAVEGVIKTKTEDTVSTIAQSKKLIKAGAKIVKIALSNMVAVRAISKIKDRIDASLVADVHNCRLALESIERGIDKLTVNPENISKEGMLRIIEKAKEKEVPLCIEISSNSLERKFSSERKEVEKYREVLAEEIVKSALNTTEFLEKESFSDIIIYLKTSDVLTTILSYQLLSDKISYPFHLEIPSIGSSLPGIIRSSISIGTLLFQGIGDVIKVSLADDPVEEVKVGYEILKSLSLSKRGPILVSCPTCGRCHTDLETVVRDVLSGIEGIEAPLKIAVMGCEVNGPGEAKDADVGIACTRYGGVLFKKGKSLRRIKEKDIARVLIEEVKKMSCS
ncbi:(E)-4-hydroxy-3-methylbut-2-enyl-diphosphate synthase [Candidatus Aerophobetes bacterium]|nr:(E)-4-hydroxy-3-methylbut-2-enyl-diphosphate synthase [Candidatus Aerophobetes bacterium]